MTAPSGPLQLAERVARAAADLGIQTAVIGAAALAAHNYVRGTEDIDLATAVSPGADLRRLESALLAQGLDASLAMPDADDALGGVLRVWDREDEDGKPVEPVEVVNFHNPHRPRHNPGRAAIQNARPLDDADPSGLRYATLPDLIALKLYSGARADHGDIVAVLRRNPDADIDAIRAAAKPYDRDDILETLLLESRAP